MLNNTINEISAAYLSEAKNSPSLIEDMAAMEKYMAESYSGRIFIELLQNADDANSTDVFVEIFNGNIIFANNGRPFDENDLVAISRTGASKKTRGSSIGYRGIGFKSTAYLTNEIIIYSNDEFFTFSKSKCANALQKPIDKIPTVRIPFIVDSIDSTLEEHILTLNKQGYNTIFVFTNAKMELFIEELKDLNNGYFIFLRNIKRCQIRVSSLDKCIQVTRQNNKRHQIVSFFGSNNEEWAVIFRGSEAIALKIQNNKVVPCNSDEALFHCFLPTTEKSPYHLKINADFSTDPSRKHITLDALTQAAIDNIATLLFDVLKLALTEQDVDFSQFIDIILMVGSFSTLNQRLSAKLDSIIQKSFLLELENGTRQSIQKCKKLPDVFENSEKSLLRTSANIIMKQSIKTDCYQHIASIDLLIQKFSKESFTAEEISETLSEKSFVEKLSPQTYAKILSFIVSSAKHASVASKPFSSPHKIYLPTDTGVVPIGQVNDSNTKPKESIKKAISESLSPYDASLFSSIVGIDKTAIYSKESNLPRIEVSQKQTNGILSKGSMPVVAKWRSAEQQCIELEKHWGNIAVDVSRQNVGYDVESTTPSGEKRYIEVKLLNKGTVSFTITNNEYTAAHQYGDRYVICLIMQGEREAKVLYIKNPLEKLSFEKRVRQWEWYCENFNGEEFSIELR